MKVLEIRCKLMCLLNDINIGSRSAKNPEIIGGLSSPKNIGDGVPVFPRIGAYGVFAHVECICTRLCCRPYWLLVSFWAHVKNSHIVSYRNVHYTVYTRPASLSSTMPEYSVEFNMVVLGLCYACCWCICWRSHWTHCVRCGLLSHIERQAYTILSCRMIVKTSGTLSVSIPILHFTAFGFKQTIM